MNVLFLMGNMLSAGGVEKITIDLANSLCSRDINVSILCFGIEDEESTKIKLNESVDLYVLSFPVNTKRNRIEFKGIITNKQIDIIINQWAVPWYVTKFIKKSIYGANIKLISVHHSLPNNNSKIQSLKYFSANSQWLKPIYSVILNLVTYISKYSLKKVYLNSDQFVLLSHSFIPIFEKYIGVCETDKISIIPNFIKLSDINIDTAKNNEIICVGRIDYNSKCTYRVVNVWKKLEPLFPNWNMTIIGNGPDFCDLKKRVENFKLERINLTGYINPNLYYRQSKILLHLSEYEGFGLVILEAMCNGVVPVVLNSFDALSDLITDNSKGIKLSYPYDETQAIDALTYLMTHENQISSMAENCRLVYTNFSEESVVKKWISLFSSLAVD